MREYELVYLVADTVAEDKQAAVFAKVKKFISDLGGANVKEIELGRRKLAYEILKNDFATYIQLNFELEGSKVRELENDLKLTPEVIRHLLTLQKATHISVLDEKIEAVGDKELESVIGERSFEQVEGETEGSRDLMAKRDKEEVVEGISNEVADEEIPEDKNEEKETPEVKVEKIEAKEEKKETKKAVKVIEKTDKKEETVEAEKVEAPVKEAPVKKAVRPKKPEAKDEAERLKQLDEKLDQILGDDL